MSEKFPWLFAARFLIRAYDYWHGYTGAQIDLMAIDQPLTVYPKDKEREKTHTRAEMRKIAEEWSRKYGEGGAMTEKIKLSDFMSGRGKANTKDDTHNT